MANTTDSTNLPGAPRAPTVAAQWRETCRLLTICNTYEGPDDFPPELAAYDAAERAVLVGPILSREDAIAKLLAAGHAGIASGEEVTPDVERAYADAVRWLEAA